MMNVTAIIGAAAAAALIASLAWGAHHKSEAHDARLQAAAATAQAEQCAQSVALLEAEAKEREAQAAKALAEAHAKADKYALRADKLLRAPAAVPGDDCASAKARAAAWLQSRGQ